MRANFIRKLADVTGPHITDRWGATCTDLGASVHAPDGRLVSVFGDTFAGERVAHGDWRSPIVLIGAGDATHRIRYERAGGADPDYARQVCHDAHGRAGPGPAVTTVIPSDLLRVGDALYLHVMVNHGFGNVARTEIWRSDDGGVSWRHLGGPAVSAGWAHRGYAQCWSWEYHPDDGWVYVVSTGFRRDRGIILRRVRPADIGDVSKYSARGRVNGRWRWGSGPTPITPGGERWGELTLRRLVDGAWVLGGFLASGYALGYRVLDSPTADLREVPVQTPLVGTGWGSEDHARGRVAQLYGGYVLPGSRAGENGGVGVLVSQWNTAQGWPYRVMQYRVTLSGC